jgi:prophage regulatory protein
MDEILRRPAVQRVTGKSRSQIYEDMKRGLFPLPVHLGAKAVGWLRSEILAWLAERVAERDKRVTNRDQRVPEINQKRDERIKRAALPPPKPRSTPPPRPMRRRAEHSDNAP